MSADPFWSALDQLISQNKIIIDRPKHKPHPGHPDMILPLDYGYVEDTQSGDGAELDAWIGSKHTNRLTGILCTFDGIKRDAEIKLLIGCTDSDLDAIQLFYGSEMKTLIVPRPGSE